ncbi:enolase C-terminal domain-like protein [Burkholderia gladioli]
MARPAARAAARPGPRARRDLRQRRFHQLRPRHAVDPARRLAARGHPRLQDQDRRARCERHDTAARRARRARPRGRTVRHANGAYAPRVALGFAEAAAAFDLRWFEEPVSSEDLDGLRGVRAGVSGRCEIAAGEYAWLPDDFRRLLASGAIDVLQADATRCGGISGFLAAAALAEAHHRDMSAHCAPALHRHVACALPRVRHIEWFHDHARIEQLLFDGAPVPRDGRVGTDDGAPGLGLALKARDAEAYAL